MLILGIILGLAAAFFQSLSYLGTRHFVQPRAAEGGTGASKQLLVLAHIWMGAASVVLLPVFWPWGRELPWRELWDPLFFTAFYYVLGQIGLMMALRYAEASRISPMLAFKLVILAGLATSAERLGYFPGLAGYHAAPLEAVQWAAVVLAVGGALVLNYSGGANHPTATAGVVLACVAYSLSDWNIGRMLGVLTPLKLPVLQHYVVPALLCYGFCGLAAVPLLWWKGSRKRKDWADAAPFAGAWLGAMFFLFSCFGVAGVVYGNILQSTRGLMSVMLGVALAHLGHHHLEAKTPRGVFVRRLAGTALMLGAVVLYAVPRMR